jgi:outer membrane protein assembly factor BamB
MGTRFKSMSAIVGALLIVAFGPAPAAVVAGDWNTGVGGNAARNSLSNEFGPTGPHLLWQGSLSAIVSQQAVTEGDVVVMARIASFDIPSGTTIVAHDLTTGAILWATQLPYNFEDSWRSRVSAIRDGQIYATRAGNTNSEYLYALPVAGGEIIWQSEALIDEGTTESLAFAENGDPIVGNFHSLVRINKGDGSTVWEVPRSCPTSDGCSAAVFGEHVYIWEASASGPKVSVFDAADGAWLYSSEPIGGGYVQQLGLLVGPDGTVYAPRTQNNPVTDYFVAFEDTGTALIEKWRVPLGYVPFASFGVGPDGSVYTYDTTRLDGTTELQIVRRDPDTGTALDTSPVMSTSFPAKPRIAIDASGTIFLTNGGFSDGRFYSFNADLTERWSVPLNGVNLGGPALGQDGIVVVCGTGIDVRAYWSCRADLDGDNDTDQSDLGILLADWGCYDPVNGCSGDLDGDDDTDQSDLGILLADWGCGIG